MDGSMEDTNQHYITKAYLDKFIHPKAGQAVLFPYRKGGRACRPRGTKKLGSAANFYRQRENGRLHDGLDEARKISEILLFSSGKRTPSSLSQCVFEDNFVPSGIDKLHLSSAAAFLFCGSPVQIHNTAMHLLLLHQVDFLNWHSTEQARTSFEEKYGGDWEAKLEESRRECLTGGLIIDVGEENWKQLGFHSFKMEEDLLRLLGGMEMTIVDCNLQGFFLTSDNPVVRTFPSAHGKQDDEVWLPVSYKRGLLWHRRALGKRTCFGHSQVRSYNRRVIKYCYKYVYSPLAEGWIEPATSQETFDPLLGHYGSLERVIAEAKPAIDGKTGKRCGEIVDFVAALRTGEKLDVVGV